jgi:hypothetical protein
MFYSIVVGYIRTNRWSIPQIKVWRQNWWAIDWYDKKVLGINERRGTMEVLKQAAI